MAFFSLAQGGGGCQRKQKKSIDQRAPQIGYEGFKSLWPLAMKNYLVTGGPLSLVESYNNKHLLVDCAVSAEKYSYCSSDVRTKRLIITLLCDRHMKRKVCGLNWQETLTSLNTGKYCPENKQSNFRIRGPRRRISHGHKIINYKIENS